MQWTISNILKNVVATMESMIGMNQVLWNQPVIIPSLAVPLALIVRGMPQMNTSKMYDYFFWSNSVGLFTLEWMTFFYLFCLELQDILFTLFFNCLFYKIFYSHCFLTVCFTRYFIHTVFFCFCLGLFQKRCWLVFKKHEHYRNNEFGFW